MKRGILFLIFVFLAGSVLAAQGVNPGSFEVDYDGVNLVREFTFDFNLDGREYLVVEGDLKEFVVLDKEKVTGREKVVVSLNLPEGLDFAGEEDIWIVAGKVRALVRVNFPYPDKFVGLDLGFSNINVGEKSDISLKVSNFGNDSVSYFGEVEVFFGDLGVETFVINESFLDAFGTNVVDFVFDGKEAFPGDYLIVAKVYYEDKVVEKRSVFRVGEKRLRILNYTREIDKGISKFDVWVESLWNSNMKNVYAEVRVIGRQSGEDVYLDRMDGFDSSIIFLPAWGKEILTGYFDASELEGELMLSVDVYFDGEVESEVVKVEVVEDNRVFFAFVAFCVLFVIFVLWKFVFLKFLKKKQ